jgi:uncharacterized protein (TIGR01319 family)
VSAGRLAACVDVGSTWTKLAVVDVDAGTLAATTAHPTTVDSDVLDGVDAALAAAADLLPGADLSTVYCCSSAGGGLRLAVVGYEALVSAEAGQRVATSAGALVVHVAAGRLDPAAVRRLRAARPDVVLLVGGTDGGDADVLTHNARQLAAARLRVPVVLAGNVDARAGAAATLDDGGVPVVASDNVLPRIGVLVPGPARAVIRDVFLRHVIGGKRLSKGPRFARLVRAATPDAVLTAVELLADLHGRGLLVVDVGGATTDVYSALVPDDDTVDVAGTLWRSRTVEGDLGVHASAAGTVAAAGTEKLPTDRTHTDLRLAELATTIALRRHGRHRDLRDVALVVASGGVYRHADPAAAAAVLDRCLHDHGGGWALPRAPRTVIDRDCVLAAAGLLAADHPDAATAVLHRYLHEA